VLAGAAGACAAAAPGPTQGPEAVMLLACDAAGMMKGPPASFHAAWR
jgi:hypothetical protein